MNLPKISIIVPVYKAEAYLHRCVDSLLAQTFTDFELLLIDDGSPDRSGEICDEYAQKDTRVRVFHKENGGVSSARQCGMDNAQGEYTIHTDPDDWVEPTMLEELYAKAKEEDADMVICDFYQEYLNKGKKHYIKQEPSALISDIILKEMIYKIHGSCCNKLIRRSCYINYNVKFPLEFSMNEDLFVNMALLKHNIKVSYLPKAFYHYELGLNENSITSDTNYTEEKYKIDLLKIKLFSDMMKGHILEREVKDKMVINLLDYMYHSSKKISSYTFCKRSFRFIGSVVRYKYISNKVRLRLLLSCLGFYGIIRKK